MKRLIIIILCVVMLLGLAPAGLFSTTAYASQGPIALNETKTLTLSTGQSATYQFTPDESGVYAFWMEQPAIAIMGIQMHFVITNPDSGEEMTAWQENHQTRLYYLNAGKTYEVKVLYGEGGTITRSFGIRKATTATSMSFGTVKTHVYPGDSDQVSLVLSAPEAVAGTFTWSSSNPQVASLELKGKTYAQVHYLSPGTSTITVSNGTTSCSYTVTVQGRPPLQVGAPVVIPAGQEGTYGFTITPTVSGRYKISTDHMYGIDVDSNDMNEVIIQGGSQGIGCELAAGSTYECVVWITSASSTDITVSLDLLNAHAVAPKNKTSYPPNAGGEISGPFPLIQEAFLEAEKEYVIRTDGCDFRGIFTPSKSGMYYLLSESDDPWTWHVICNENILEPENILQDGHSTVEFFYYFEAGNTYEIIAGKQPVNGDKIKLSSSSVLTEPEEAPESQPTEAPSDEMAPEDAPPGAIPQPPSVSVDKNQFLDYAQNGEEGFCIQLDMTSDESAGLDKAAFQAAADRGMMVEIMTSAGSMILDQKTLETISQFFSGESIHLFLNETSQEELTEAQKESIQELDVKLTVSADIMSEGKFLHDFEGGNVKVRLPFHTEGAAYVVFYLAEDGSLEEMPTSIGEGYLEFETGHFSTFAVVLTGEDAAPDTAGDNDGNTMVIPIIGGVVVLAAAVAVILILKKRKI